jgi:signal transduction histidine kinase
MQRFIPQALAGLLILQFLLWLWTWTLVEKRYERLREAEEKLTGSDWASLQSSKHEFMSMVDHHLGTPLSGLRWNMELLEQEKASPAQLKHVQGIRDSCDYIERIIHALHDAAMIEMRTFFIEKELVNVREVAETIVREKELILKQRKLNISMDIDPTVTIKADAKLLRLLIEYLVTSTVQYTEPSGTVAFATKKEANGIALSVFNSGKGIPADKQPQLFEKPLPFRSEHYETENYQGIGLYIIKSIAQRLSWRVWFESDASRGVTFFVLIPTEQE